MAIDFAENPRRAHSLFWRILFLVPVAILRLVARIQGRKPIPGVHYEELTIPSREPGRTIKAVRYRQSRNANLGSSVPRNVHLNWHGSGWVVYHFGSDHAFAGEVAKALDIDFYDLDYRKSPEHPFPAAQEDVEDALLYFANLDSVRSISVSGFSAGANMAVTGPNHIRKKLTQSKISELSSISLVYPPTAWDAPRIPPSKNTSGGGFPLPWLVKRLFNACMSVAAESFATKRFRTAEYDVDEILSKNLLVVSGTADTLYTEAAEFVKMLQGKGHPNANFLSIANAGHSFDKKPKTELARQNTKRTYDAIIENIRRGLESTS
ncbi:hypothetical protein OC846_002957 [Tilletia horrida]|uniref:Alpha/beta hydrolase fold-3 domain-containing protein n=1 Tax=Tilletia horrida TaxID=155126 RepID=A0AAN6GTE6_9BASI|nr:hypothetical protein OC846_002957 [Tilletia horrida]KAK0566827.1 hypothetical protein OC861_003023 [Tilletia horrida]